MSSAWTNEFTQPEPAAKTHYRRGSNDLSQAPEITGVVLVICPKTGLEFSTGLLTDKPLLNGPFDLETTAYCPYCKEEHKWRPSEARYIESLPPKDWVENRRATSR
jgi:hypothetical protein